MRLKKYLPTFISSVKEFKELDKVVSIELDEIHAKLEQIQNNQFIESANDEGLRRYEKMLDIVHADDLETRKFNILNKYNSTIPFTLRWLNNTLTTTLGNGNFLLDMDYKRYTLTISIAACKEQHIETLYKDLRSKIPCNVVLTITTLSSIEMSNYIGTCIRTVDIINL